MGWCILGVWMASMALDAVPQLKYQPPAIIHGLMTIVVTTAFGSAMVRRD